MDGLWKRLALALALALACVCEGFEAPPSISINNVNLLFEFNGQERMLPLVEGHDYTLRCVGSNPRWFRDSNTSPMSNSENLALNSFNSSRDSGTYRCVVDGSRNVSVRISAGNPVVVPTSEIKYQRLSTSSSSSRVSLNMFVDSEPPSGRTRNWSYNGDSTLPSEDFLIGNTDLVFPLNLDSSLTGNYTLQVRRGEAMASGTTFFAITDNPLVTILPAMSVSVSASERLSLQCVTNISVPPATFQWTVNGVSINSSEGKYVLRDIVVDGLPGLELEANNLTILDSGRYSCTADNSYRDVSSSTTLVAYVNVTGPLPPVDFSVSQLSDCMVDVTWRDQTNTGDYSVAPSDAYTIQIQYITSSGPVVLDFLVSTMKRGTGRVRYVQQNTTFMLRGRAMSAMHGSSPYSDWFGPFQSFTDPSFPTPIPSVAASAPNSLAVTWQVEEESDCFKVVDIRAECLESDNATSPLQVGMASSDQVIVNNLSDHTYYNCTVTWSLSATGVRGDPVTVSEIGSPFSDLVRAFTLPGAPQVPSEPKKSVVTDKSFVITIQPMSNQISHYQVFVLRLGNDVSILKQDPSNVYGSDFTFSDCKTINSEDNKGSFAPYIAAEMSADNLETEFTVGGGKIGDVDISGRCNDALLAGVSYSTFVRAYPYTLGQLEQQQQMRRRKRNTGSGGRQYAVFSSSGFLDPPITTISGNAPPTNPIRPSGSVIAVALPVVLVILAVVAATIVIALVVGGLLYKKHQRSKYSPRSSTSSMSDGTMDSYNMLDLNKNSNGMMIEMKEKDAFDDPLDVPFEPSGDVTAEDFKDHVEKYDAKRQLLFQEEFEWISKNSQWHEAAASQDERNDAKNRYSNITAFDHSRVKLKEKPGVECSDYINANYVTGYNRPQEYIASQGPLEQTVEDFWRMVWEQHSTTIIMLTNVVELGKIKCTQYWPNSNTTMYGDIAVTLESTHTFPDYTIRTLSVELCKTNETRRVLQFHYTKWPDYGTPKLAAPLLNFLKIVHESCSSEEKAGPMVVHCSAGVGRSGTVLSIDYCLQQLRKEGVVNVCKFVQQMREERNYMVQTDQQYTFIHYAILEAITYGDTSFEVDKFITSYVELQRTDSKGPALLQDEFERLGKVKTMVKKSSFQNRIRMKGAPQRHFHSSFHGGSTSGSGSIQQCLGHFLDSYNQVALILATEGAEEKTANRFWEMVWDNDCRLIVMLTPRDEDFFQYWSTEECQFGSIRVVVESESEEHLYTCRKIRLSNAKVDGLTHNVVHYQFIGWTSNCMPKVPDFVSFFCSVLQARVNMPEKSKIMVHDTASIGPSGIFCSLLHCIQRVQIERVIDIFQAVQYVQLQRPGCVSTLKDYVFLYDCVYEYLVKNT